MSALQMKKDWMLTTSITTEQVLDVWEELNLAHGGTNGYGGDVAEIYAYRLMPSMPSLTSNKEDLFYKDSVKAWEVAGYNLLQICRLFTKKRSIDHGYENNPIIKIEVGLCSWKDVWNADWDKKDKGLILHHRCHVRIETK